MLEATQELTTASNLLQASLDRYIAACSAIQTCYGQNIALTRVPPALLDCVASESLSVALHETKIKLAKSIIGRTRNLSSALSPVHSLPSEVLIRIFRQVIDDSRSGISRSPFPQKVDTSFPKYPDFLSHVCFRWRQILLDLSIVWSRIDLTYSHTLSTAFLARAQACATRSGILPLDVYLQIPSSHGTYDGGALFEFLESISTRTRSLDLKVPTTELLFDRIFYEACLENAVPGVLQKLTIKDRGSYTPDFLIGSDRLNHVDFRPEGCFVVMPQEAFEELMLSVTTLRLKGLYPYWTSKAYHGLTELRLESPNTGNIRITNSALFDILRHSPKLRILHFDIHIADDEDLPIDGLPVLLQDLEVLNLGTLQFGQLNTFFRVLACGPKPLQLTLTHDRNMTRVESTGNDFTRFANHSNITELCVNHLRRLPELETLLGLFPRIRVLALSEFADTTNHGAFNRDENVGPPADFHLETLHILKSRFDLDNLCQVAKLFPVRVVTIWRFYIQQNSRSVGEEKATEELLKSYPVVRFMNFWDASPIDSWTRPL